MRSIRIDRIIIGTVAINSLSEGNLLIQVQNLCWKMGVYSEQLCAILFCALGISIATSGDFHGFKRFVMRKQWISSHHTAQHRYYSHDLITRDKERFDIFFWKLFGLFSSRQEIFHYFKIYGKDELVL